MRSPSGSGGEVGAGDDLERVERTEVTATRLSAALLVALCLYVVATIAAGLCAHVEPDRSFLGLGVAAAALLVMPALAQGKRRVNRVLASAALRPDIAETTVCAGMAATVLLGIALHATLGWWWAEYAAAVGLLGGWLWRPERSWRPLVRVAHVAATTTETPAVLRLSVQVVPAVLVASVRITFSISKRPRGPG